MQIPFIGKRPVYGTDESAGADLCVWPERPVILYPGARFTFPSKLRVELPFNTFGMMVVRSSAASKHKLSIAGGISIIDADYRGEMSITLVNDGDSAFTVNPGDRLVQLIIVPFIKATYFETDSLTPTARGEGGHGSTGER